eukprot:TRINITY_DN13610_c0_g1_i2.p1 TRINITY_DN13610_c0_g1~~TRINITY_DN13610_c0_g1_i2.p1  ORF type:complete len:458 (-),score=119.14 TRINITY_DN13610_c0_g1_i2:4-1377(-)
MNPESELLMFTNEKELQNIRKWFELIINDSRDLIIKLKSMSNGQLPKIKQHKNQDNHDQENEESEEQKEGEEGEEGEEEEELTLEDYIENLFDSINTFNELIATLNQNYTQYLQQKKTLNQLGSQLQSKLQEELNQLSQRYYDEVKEKKEQVKINAQLEEDNSALKQQLDENKVKLCNLEVNSKEQKKLLDQLMQQVPEMEKQYKMLLNEKVQLQFDMQNKQESLQQQQSQIQQLNQTLANYSQHLETQAASLKNLQEHSSGREKELENEIQKNNLTIEAQKKEIMKLDDKYRQARKDLEDVTNNTEKQNSQIKQQDLHLQQQKNKIKEQKQKILEQSNQIKEISQQFSTFRTEKEQQIGNLEDAVAKLKAKTDIKEEIQKQTLDKDCLLYTSDAADDMQCVDLGGRRIIKKKKRSSNMPGRPIKKNKDSHRTRAGLREAVPEQRVSRGGNTHRDGE